MDLKNFPMDVQTCIMQLESCKYCRTRTNQVVIEPTSAGQILLIHIYKTIQRITPYLEGISADSQPFLNMLGQVGKNTLEN